MDFSWILALLPLLLSAQNLTDNSLAYRPRYQHPAYRLLPQRTNIQIPKSFIIGRTVGNVPQVSDRELPCCRDESGGSLCRTLKTNDPRGFGTRCASEPDFSLVVCCKTCTEMGTDYRERAASFFSGTQNTTNCFDRMSLAYCSRFQTGTDAWNARRWSCDTEHYRLGFRECKGDREMQQGIDPKLELSLVAIIAALSSSASTHRPLQPPPHPLQLMPISVEISPIGSTIFPLKSLRLSNPQPV
ncbi:unnamed protein product, partial [Mesorhabditis belari]|uniref:Uncharacterized protein n=1 Tax=Mesorhabditis belari TaxID=2138241 RepID=A0AAF3EZ35_9BILA